MGPLCVCLDIKYLGSLESTQGLRVALTPLRVLQTSRVRNIAVRTRTHKLIVNLKWTKNWDFYRNWLIISQVPKLEECAWIDLQARIWKGLQTAHRPVWQLHHWERVGQVWHHLHGGSCAWNLHCWGSFQRSEQLSLAIQAELTKGWLPQDHHTFRGRRWSWKPRGQDQPAYPQNELKLCTAKQLNKETWFLCNLVVI